MRSKVIRKRDATHTGSSRIVEIILVALFLLLPFWVSVTGYEKFRLPKEILVTLLTAGAAAAFLLKRSRRPAGLRLGWEMLLVLGVAYALVSGLSSDVPGIGLQALVNIAVFAVLLLLISAVAEESFQHRLWLLISAAVSVNAVIAVLQVYGWFPLMETPGGDELAGRMTPAGFIGDVNTGGFVFALVSLVLLYQVFGTGRHRRLALLFLLLNLTGLAFTQTLAALAGFLICLVLWLAYHHWWTLQQPDGAGQLVRLWIFLALAAAACAGAAWKSGLLTRVGEVADRVEAGDWVIATSGRLPVYLITWEMIKEKPWFGHGLDSFGRDFFFHRSGTEYGASLDMIDQPGAFRQVHNEFLQIWEEMGIIGLALFLLLVGIPLIRAVPSMFNLKEPQRAYWLAILGIGAVLFLINALAFFPLQVPGSAALIVLLFGGIRHLQIPIAEDPAPGPETGHRRLVKGVAVTACLLLVVFVQVQKWRANYQMGIATYLLKSATEPQFDLSQQRVFAVEALDRLNEAEEIYPYFYEIYNLQGTAAMMLGRSEEAVSRYAIAGRHIPSPEVFTNLAAAYLASSEPGKARTYVELALRYNPAYSRAQQALQYLETKSP